MLVIEQTVKSQKTIHSSSWWASYGVYFVSVWENNDSVIKSISCDWFNLHNLWQSIQLWYMCGDLPVHWWWFVLFLLLSQALKWKVGSVFLFWLLSRFFSYDPHWFSCFYLEVNWNILWTLGFYFLRPTLFHCPFSDIHKWNDLEHFMNSGILFFKVNIASLFFLWKLKQWLMHEYSVGEKCAWRSVPVGYFTEDASLFIAIIRKSYFILIQIVMKWWLKNLYMSIQLYRILIQITRQYMLMCTWFVF